MLFNLNSIDEPNPRNFKNTLSDNITIKPNSYVCLTGATITRQNHLQKITLSNNALLQVKLNPYDVAEFTLAAGTYTLDEFCALINANFPNYDTPDTYGSVSALTSLKATPKGLPPNRTIEFEFMRKGALSNIVGIRSHLSISPNFSYFKVQSIVGKSNPNIKPAGSLGNIGLSAATIIGGNSASYACAALVSTNTTVYNPLGYTPPTNQENKLALNMSNDESDFADNYFFIGQPNLQNIKVLFGKATYDESNNRYSNAAFFGSGGYTAPNDNVNNCPFWLNFKNTGLFDFNVLNKNTGAFDAVGSDMTYEPGDFINPFIDTVSLKPLGDGRISFPFLSHLQSNGLGLMFLMRLIGVTVSWNSTSARVLDMAEYVAAQLNTIRQNNWNVYNTFWEAQGYNSHGRPIGVRIGSGTIGDVNYADCNDNDGFLWRQNSDQGVSAISLQTGNSRAWLNSTPLFQRYSAGAAPAVSPDVRSHLLMSQPDGILMKAFPYMISFYFRLVDDSAKVTGTDQHSFINSITGQTILSVIPAQASAHDAEVRFDDGSVTNFTLLDSGATRINIAYGTDYYMALKYNGTTHGAYEVVIHDINANVKYSHSQAVAKDIENIGAVSNQETNPATGTNYAKSLNGYFGHLRIHSKCQNASFSATGWDTIYDDLYDYIRNGTISGNYWWGYREQILTNNNPVYQVVGNLNSSRTLTPVFDKDTLSIPKDTTWGDFVQPFFRHAYYVPNNLRVTNLDVHDYQGDEIGILNVANLNTGSLETFDFEDEDARGNVMKEPEQIFFNNPLLPTDPIVADVEQVDLEDKTVYVEIPNLPHRSYNGVTRSQDKTIGVIPVNGINANRLERDNLDIITAYPPTKNWIPLNNPGSIILNELHVKLSDVRGKELDESEIAQETAISIEIKEKNEIF